MMKSFIICRLLFAKYLGDEIKNDEMGGACRKRERNEKWKQHFSLKT
jgi:hypothetical protein